MNVDLLHTNVTKFSLKEKPWTPLMAAVENNQKEVVEYLLNQNVLTEMAPFTPSALHIAAYRNHIECIRLILQHKLRIGDPNIDHLDDSRVRETPLHVTARHCCFESSRLLLQFGANPKAVNGLGETPLHIACQEKCHLTVGLLLDNKFLVSHIFI